MTSHEQVRSKRMKRMILVLLVVKYKARNVMKQKDKLGMILKVANCRYLHIVMEGEIGSESALLLFFPLSEISPPITPTFA
jgi:hypothetical protein